MLASWVDSHLGRCCSGSVGGTAVMASHQLTIAEPGQPVPASAVHRLTAVANRIVTMNGRYRVARTTAVVTTRAKAPSSD